MDSPLWIDTHAPDIDDLPQSSLRDVLGGAVDRPINLALYGPAGSGKTAAVRALARRAHDDPEGDLVELNVADFFERTKAEVADDPRFSSFISAKRKRESSKAALITHVLKETAGYPPVSGRYKTLLLDNAEAAREDFQQALRRVMERHHRSTQFVLATRQPSGLLPPILSRCFPVPVRAPTNDEIVGVLETVLATEGVDADRAGLEYVSSHAKGNLRAALLGAQAVAEDAGEVTQSAAYEVLREVGPDERVAGLVDAARDGEFTQARSTLDELLVNEGYTGNEVLDALVRVVRHRGIVDDAAFTRLVGEIDFDLATGANDRVHLSRLLAELGST